MITRFAPSPTGPLHLGHAYSAILAHDLARLKGGAFFLRIEDVDRHRSKPAWEAQIVDDLTWLGLTWDGPIVRQSNRLGTYRLALTLLWDQGVLYPCSCSRKDIQAALEAPQEGGFQLGPDGIVYPGTCRNGKSDDAAMPDGQTLRLNIERALSLLGDAKIEFAEMCLSAASTTVTSHDLINEVGDFVVSRKDFLGSYHLSVVVDDAAQGVTDVVRGEDLFDATKVHVLLQRILGLPTPVYHHHRLIRDDQGRRLAKRDDARALSKYRAEGATPADVRRMVRLSDI